MLGIDSDEEAAPCIIDYCLSQGLRSTSSLVSKMGSARLLLDGIISLRPAPIPLQHLDHSRSGHGTPVQSISPKVTEKSDWNCGSF